MGTLRSRYVALVTRDPALYAELAGAMRERRTPSVSLLPGQRIPARAAVVLTSPAEVELIDHPRVLAVPEVGGRAALWAAVESALRADAIHEEVVVGFDPGPRPGYAVISGGTLLVTGTLDSPEEAAPLGTHVRHRFPGRDVRFRVGSGDPLTRNRIVNALLPLHRPIEIANERGTTPRGLRVHRDGAAAGAIARTPGRTVHGTTSLSATPGEISNLQRVSREGSGGRFTISRDVAVRVLQGELTLGDALADGARRYGPPSRDPRPAGARPLRERS